MTMIPAWLPDTMTTLPDRMVERALLWGLEGLELRTVGGASDRVPYVNEARLRRRLDESELAACSIVPGLFEGAVTDRAAWMNELTLLEESLAFCRRLRCPIVVVSTFEASSPMPQVAAVLRRAGDLAGAQGVRIAVLNEAGRSCENGADLLDLVAGVDHEAVGAAWDPQADLAAGGDPAGIAVPMAGAAFMMRWAPDPVAGSTDLDLQLDALAGAGFDGPVSLVLPWGALPTDGLRAASFMIDRIRAAARGHDGQRTSPA